MCLTNHTSQIFQTKITIDKMNKFLILAVISLVVLASFADAKKKHKDFTPKKTKTQTTTEAPAPAPSCPGIPTAPLIQNGNNTFCAVGVNGANGNNYLNNRLSCESRGARLCTLREYYAMFQHFNPTPYEGPAVVPAGGSCNWWAAYEDDQSTGFNLDTSIAATGNYWAPVFNLNAINGCGGGWNAEPFFEFIGNGQISAFPIPINVASYAAACCIDVL